jgi:hypothetical protein
MDFLRFLRSWCLLQFWRSSLFLTKLTQNDGLLESAVKKLRLWLNFLTAQHAMAMNAMVTPHLPVCLYSATGGKVNRQVARTRWTVACTRWTVDHSAPGRWITRTIVPAACWATWRSKYFNRFSATSSGKVFFGPSAFRTFSISEAFEIFSRIKLITKNDLAPRRGYCWGSASSPKVL